MTREDAIYRLKNAAWLGIDDDFDHVLEAVNMAIEALPDDAYKRGWGDAIESVMIKAMTEQGYTGWLEKIIVEAEPSWICEDTPCPEWCNENCSYASVQVACLRHLYDVRKGGEEEWQDKNYKQNG